MGGRLQIPYEGLLDIPEGKVGKFSVRHIHEKKGALLQTASYRTALYGHHAGPTVRYDHPTRWHELLEGEGRWTSDLPIEQYQQRESIVGFRGRVLVGGLGLGVVVRMLAASKNVSQIDVVEKSPEVVALVGPHVKQGDPRIRIHTADLADFLWQTGAAKAPPWHYAFFDIWTADNEYTFYNTVLPLRRMATPLVKYRVTAWNEDIMRGQVMQSIYGPLHPARRTVPFLHFPSLAELAKDTEDEWHDEWQARLVPFYKGLLSVNARLEEDQGAVKFLAWKWAKTYDGSPEFGADWLTHMDKHWEFARMMAVL
jgi:hypothetical protein